MIVYRLCKDKYKNDLTGHGAELVGGRWNSRGVALVYTSDSRALCTTEIAVHTPLGILPKNFCLLSIEIPIVINVKELEKDALPSDWQATPFNAHTQQIGNEFVRENKYLVLKVPSVVVPGDFNYLINPRHKDFNKIKIKRTTPFQFDARLFK